MTGSGSRFAQTARLAALLALGALGAHQLRYLIAYGADGGQALRQQGHSYLLEAIPFLIPVALGLLLATVLVAALSRRPQASSGGLDPVCTALACSAALLVIYTAQELLEGALFAGHASGIDAVLAAGGWVALPLCLGLGAFSALVLRAFAVIDSVLAPGPRPARLLRRAPRSRGAERRAFGVSPLSSPLQFGLARRPPPALC